MEQNIKKVTDSILSGKDVRESIAEPSKDGAGIILESVSKDVLAGILGAIKNDDSRFYDWLDETGKDYDEGTALEEFGEEYAEFLVKFVENQISSKDVWSAYFPDFCESPYWYIGFGKDGAECDSGTGQFTKEWGEVEQDLENEGGGGDYSEISVGNCNASAEAIKKMAAIADALGNNEDENWCVYKGSLHYWVGGDCTDNLPEIGINTGGEIYFDDLSIVNISTSNVKKAYEIFEKYYDDIVSLDLWPGEILASDDEDEEDDPDKEVVQKMVDELEAAGLKVKNNF